MSSIDSQKPIALFDSGLGGLTVLAELRRRLPNEQFIYLGDTARTPYGSKSRDTIRRYSLECAHFLTKHDIKLLVVACNTASSFALDIVQQQCTVPVIGTIEPAARAACSVSSGGRIGIIATEATVQSNVFRNTMEKMRPGAFFYSKECPLLVPFVEQGIVTGPLIEQVIEMYLASLKSLSIDTLVLGCTHYPMLQVALQNFFGASVTLIDCASTTADEVKEYLLQQHLTREKSVSSTNQKSYLQKPGDLFFVTDSGLRFKHLAAQFLEDPVVEVLNIESFEKGL
jgi:glutamate racemase